MKCYLCEKKALCVLLKPLCRSHYDFVKNFIVRRKCKYPIPEGYRKSCSVQSCYRVAKAGHDKCPMHEHRLIATGTTNARVSESKCRHCNKRVFAKNMCVNHYNSNRKWGDPLRSENWRNNRVKNTVCLLCDKPARAKGYCPTHYYSQVRRGKLKTKGRKK